MGGIAVFSTDKRRIGLAGGDSEESGNAIIERLRQGFTGALPGVSGNSADTRGRVMAILLHSILLLLEVVIIVFIVVVVYVCWFQDVNGNDQMRTMGWMRDEKQQMNEGGSTFVRHFYVESLPGKA